MLKKILITALVLIGVLVVVTFFLPSNARVDTSLTINATPDKIYPHVVDLRSWPDWTVWSREKDPDCKWSFEGEGEGAKMSWDGPVHLKGNLVLDTAEPEKGITYTINFDGFPPGTGSVLMAPEATGTKVTWVSDMELPLTLRWLALFMHGAMEEEFQKNLVALKTRSEGDGAKKAIEASGKKDKEPK